jgi:hypothetical protein
MENPGLNSGNAPIMEWGGADGGRIHSCLKKEKKGRKSNMHDEARVNVFRFICICPISLSFLSSPASIRSAQPVCAIAMQMN